MAIEKLFKIKEVAALSRVPAYTIRREIKAGRLSAVAASPGKSAPLLIAESAWQDWMESHACARVESKCASLRSASIDGAFASSAA